MHDSRRTDVGFCALESGRGRAEGAGMSGEDKLEGAQGPVDLPIGWELDLHTFQPGDVKELIPDYIAACREKGIQQIRLVHGKGTGALRRTVHALLSTHPDVISYSLDHPQFGGWGATLVNLRPKGS
jgi:DNA-nicking Smr family endonuclease